MSSTTEAPHVNLNSADFASQRELSNLKSRKASNPNFRMMPEISKSAKQGVIDTEPDDDIVEEQKEEIDYKATSLAIYNALKQIKGHAVFSKTEKEEINDIVNGNNDHVLLLVLTIAIGLIVGVLIGKYFR